jgi:hypothetical protein
MNEISSLFPAGPPIAEAEQIGRRPFIDGLEQRMLRAEKVKLLEPRLVGKTSAAKAVVDRFRLAGRLAAEVDLAATTDCPPAPWRASLHPRWRPLRLRSG